MCLRVFECVSNTCRGNTAFAVELSMYHTTDTIPDGQPDGGAVGCLELQACYVQDNPAFSDSSAPGSPHLPSRQPQLPSHIPAFITEKLLGFRKGAVWRSDGRQPVISGSYKLPGQGRVRVPTMVARWEAGGDAGDFGRHHSNRPTSSYASSSRGLLAAECSTQLSQQHQLARGMPISPHSPASKTGRRLSSILRRNLTRRALHAVKQNGEITVSQPQGCPLRPPAMLQTQNAANGQAHESHSSSRRRPQLQQEEGAPRAQIGKEMECLTQPMQPRTLPLGRIESALDELKAEVAALRASQSALLNTSAGTMARGVCNPLRSTVQIVWAPCKLCMTSVPSAMSQLAVVQSYRARSTHAGQSRRNCQCCVPCY